MKVRFWGTRGSIPTPGPKTVRYGGNTSCVEVRTEEGIIVFDAGTGIRELGHSLLDEYDDRPLTVHIFISHTHWDHIQGFPFFLPAYRNQNHIHVFGPPGRDKSLEQILRDQMDSEYFPVALGDLTPNLHVREFRHEVAVGEARVSGFYVNHPAMTLAFRLQYDNRSIVYLTDNEPYVYTLSTQLGGTNSEREYSKQQDQKLINFIAGADLFVAEAQYTLEEYLTSKIGWGHSPLDSVVEFAAMGKVKRLAIFHHDPLHSDETLDSMIGHARELLKKRGHKLECFGAQEGLQLSIK